MSDVSSPGLAENMLPVVFGGCFGWFHPAPSGRGGGIAALLCPGASQDFCNGYRPFRLNGKV